MKHKYTVNQLIDMSQEEIEKICGGCIYGKCPFPKKFMKLREDGYCIRECYIIANKWIEYDNILIENAKKECNSRVKKLRERIKRNKKLIKEIEQQQ